MDMAADEQTARHYREKAVELAVKYARSGDPEDTGDLVEAAETIYGYITGSNPTAQVAQYLEDEIAQVKAMLDTARATLVAATKGGWDRDLILIHIAKQLGGTDPEQVRQDWVPLAQQLADEAQRYRDLMAAQHEEHRRAMEGVRAAYAVERTHLEQQYRSELQDLRGKLERERAGTPGKAHDSLKRDVQALGYVAERLNRSIDMQALKSLVGGFDASVNGDHVNAAKQLGSYKAAIGRLHRLVRDAKERNNAIGYRDVRDVLTTLAEDARVPLEDMAREERTRRWRVFEQLEEILPTGPMATRGLPNELAEAQGAWGVYQQIAEVLSVELPVLAQDAPAEGERCLVMYPIGGGARARCSRKQGHDNGHDHMGEWR